MVSSFPVDLFSLLGVNAILGRTILPSDEKAPGQSPLVVIGYDYWREIRARSRSGWEEDRAEQLSLHHYRCDAAGVLRLAAGQRIDVSVPLNMAAQVRPDFAMAGTPYDVFTAPFRNWLYVMARLKPGVANDRARKPTWSRSSRDPCARPREGLTGLPYDSPAVRQSFLH